MNAAATRQDGRHARSARNRRAMAQAALDIILETGEEADPAAVAERANVSRRTVFRLFQDLEALHAEANLIMAERVRAAHPPPMPVPGESLEQRVTRVVEHRAAIYELITPVRRIGERRYHSSPAVRTELRRARGMLRAHLQLMLGDAVRGRGSDRLHAAELQTSWAAWETLRRVQECSVPTAKRIVRQTVLAILEADD